MHPLRTSSRFLVRRLTCAAMLVLALALAGCTPAFYKLHKLSISVPSPAGSTATDTPPSNVQPYLTLRAYVNDSNIFAATKDFNHDLQVLTVTLDFQSPGSTISTTVLAYDIPSGQNKADFGREVLKAAPIIISTQEAFNLRIASSAVEKNLADHFLKGLQVIQNAAGPALASTAGPAAMQALQAATSVLKEFQVSDKPTSSETVATLNPTAGASGLKTMVFLIVPTGDVGPEEQLPESEAKIPQESPSGKNGIPIDPTPAYRRRIQKIENTTFVLCSGSDEPRLCERRGTQQKPHTDYAYTILVPELSYRITFPGLLWPSLPPDATCQFTRQSVDLYKSVLSAQTARMTEHQLGIEKELLRTAEHVIQVREARAANNRADVFAALRDEFIPRVPSGWLFTAPHKEGRPYSDIHSTLRSCIKDDGRVLLSGAVDEYVAAITSVITADNEYVTPLAAGETQAAKEQRLTLMYVRALEQLRRIDDAKGPLKLENSTVAGLLADDIARAEWKIFSFVFQQPLSVLVKADPADAAAVSGAMRPVKSLLIDPQYSRCDLCLKNANELLKRFAGPALSLAIMAEIQVVKEGASLVSQAASVVGEAELKKIMVGNSNEGDLNDLRASIDKVAETAKKAVTTGKAADMEDCKKTLDGATKEARKDGLLFEAH